MSDTNTEKSVGLVTTQLMKIQLPAGGLKLENGGILPELNVAYETYGALSSTKDNVIFICHALSGDAHVAGYHDSSKKNVAGWWDEMVGPGKGIDTNHYLVICANILGGCKGTTGPSSINPKTGKPYGSAFPKITISDMVDVHRLLVKQLGIDHLAAVIGGSLGGMQALDWTIRHPEMIDRCICIASATSLSAQALAFDIVGRDSITSDPDWQGGDYYGTGHPPHRGLSQARKIGHITYLSPEMMTKKFGREKHNNGDTDSSFSTDFQVESYLDHQGDKFVDRFDANSYLHITSAIDEYDLTERFGSLEKAFGPIKGKVLVVALSSDWLFPPEQSVEIANALLHVGKKVSYCNLQAPHGHDAFLVDIKHLSEVMRAFLPWVGTIQRPPISTCLEFDHIANMVRPGTRVLDLGCGDCDLLSMLTGKNNISGI
ncbi:MAG: homoserine O-acetyltransferase, partial [Kiritimatiellae bacterium]|nr:homoserine O-acetyltransferase [Kiritimatiellia bacterium]